MNLADMRKRSETVVATLGYPTNPALPLMDLPQRCRSLDEVVDRLFAMHCVAACAYGFDRSRASIWLHREVRQVLLTENESQFLRDGSGNKQQFMVQIEAMWALAWYVGVADNLAFQNPCSSDFVKRLPDLKNDELSRSFRSRVQTRSLDSVLQECDLAYCLHWAIQSAELPKRSTTGRVKPYVIIERRRALEWLISSDEWDEVSMDT